MSYSVREWNVARLEKWCPRQTHVWYFGEKHVCRVNLITDNSDTEIVDVDTVNADAARTRWNIQLETFESDGPEASLNDEQISMM